MNKQKFKYQFACILAIVSVLFGFDLKIAAAEKAHVISTPFLLSAQPESAATTNLSALELFRKVYESRYTWNKQFPGYTAEVEFKQGKNKYKGEVRLNPDLSVEVTGIDNAEASQTVKNQMLMLAIHRRRTPFEVAHKNQTFKIGATKNSGVVEIIEMGKTTEARYQLANNQIIQVNRQLGSQNVVVKTLDTEVTPEGYIPTQYQSTFYDSKTNQLIGEEISTDTYKKIGDYYLLTRQVIQHKEDGEQFEVELNFDQIKLMQA